MGRQSHGRLLPIFSIKKDVFEREQIICIDLVSFKIVAYESIFFVSQNAITVHLKLN